MSYKNGSTSVQGQTHVNIVHFNLQVFHIKYTKTITLQRQLGFLNL